jgi:F-type H+-transporting ATPase subunit b
MKIFCFSRKRRMATVQVILAVVVAGLLVFSVGAAVSATGGDEAAHGPGWVSTDTYRLLHFIVLAGGLFYLLRKPVAQALGARVKGIEAQLSELEAQKAAAEQKLAEYNQKFAQLEKESQNIAAEYVQ